MSTENHTPGPIMAGINRSVAHFRADPEGADATPSDVLFISDQAAKLDAQIATLLVAANRALAWSDRQGGPLAGMPPEVAEQLRAAIAKAQQDPSQ